MLFLLQTIQQLSALLSCQRNPASPTCSVDRWQCSGNSWDASLRADAFCSPGVNFLTLLHL